MAKSTLFGYKISSGIAVLLLILTAVATYLTIVGFYAWCVAGSYLVDWLGWIYYVIVFVLEAYIIVMCLMASKK
jgi:hypothetical protein